MANKHKLKSKDGKLTLKQVVEAAHDAGVKVTVSLVPNKAQTNAKQDQIASERERHGMNAHDYPGDPSCRSIIAFDATDDEIGKVFKDNPTSKWVITSTRVIDRDEFTKTTIKA